MKQLANFEYYKIFCRVAACGSISGAARELELTQPTVTHYIKRLEEELGCVLFLRGKKGVTLTTQGELLFPYAQNAYENLSRAERELIRYQEKETGELIVGANETSFHHFLLPYIREYRNKYPGIHLQIVNNVTPVIFKQIEASSVDCAVILCPEDLKKEGYLVRPLKEMEFCLIAGETYRRLQGKSLSMSELCGYPLITINQSTISGQMIAELLTRNGLTHDIEVQTADLVVPSVESQLGIGVVPMAFAREALQRGTVFEVKVDEVLPKCMISFVCAEDKIQKPGVAAFWELLEEREKEN